MKTTVVENKDESYDTSFKEESIDEEVKSVSSKKSSKPKEEEPPVKTIKNK